MGPPKSIDKQIKAAMGTSSQPTLVPPRIKELYLKFKGKAKQRDEKALTDLITVATESPSSAACIAIAKCKILLAIDDVVKKKHKATEDEPMRLIVEAIDWAVKGAVELHSLQCGVLAVRLLFMCRGRPKQVEDRIQLGNRLKFDSAFDKKIGMASACKVQFITETILEDRWSFEADYATEASLQDWETTVLEVTRKLPVFTTIQDLIVRGAHDKPWTTWADHVKNEQVNAKQQGRIPADGKQKLELLVLDVPLHLRFAENPSILSLEETDRVKRVTGTRTKDMADKLTREFEEQAKEERRKMVKEVKDIKQQIDSGSVMKETGDTAAGSGGDGDDVEKIGNQDEVSKRAKMESDVKFRLDLKKRALRNATQRANAVQKYVETEVVARIESSSEAAAAAAASKKSKKKQQQPIGAIRTAEPNSKDISEYSSRITEITSMPLSSLITTLMGLEESTNDDEDNKLYTNLSSDELYELVQVCKWIETGCQAPVMHGLPTDQEPIKAAAAALAKITAILQSDSRINSLQNTDDKEANEESLEIESMLDCEAEIFMQARKMLSDTSNVSVITTMLKDVLYRGENLEILFASLPPEKTIAMVLKEPSIGEFIPLDVLMASMSSMVALLDVDFYEKQDNLTDKESHFLSNLLNLSMEGDVSGEIDEGGIFSKEDSENFSDAQENLPLDAAGPINDSDEWMKNILNDIDDNEGNIDNEQAIGDTTDDEKMQSGTETSELENIEAMLRGASLNRTTRLPKESIADRRGKEILATEERAHLLRLMIEHVKAQTLELVKEEDEYSPMWNQQVHYVPEEIVNSPLDKRSFSMAANFLKSLASGHAYMRHSEKLGSGTLEEHSLRACHDVLLNMNFELDTTLAILLGIEEEALQADAIDKTFIADTFKLFSAVSRIPVDSYFPQLTRQINMYCKKLRKVDSWALDFLEKDELARLDMLENVEDVKQVLTIKSKLVSRICLGLGHLQARQRLTNSLIVSMEEHVKNILDPREVSRGLLGGAAHKISPPKSLFEFGELQILPSELQKYAWLMHLGRLSLRDLIHMSHVMAFFMGASFGSPADFDSHFENVIVTQKHVGLINGSSPPASASAAKERGAQNSDQTSEPLQLQDVEISLGPGYTDELLEHNLFHQSASMQADLERKESEAGGGGGKEETFGARLPFSTQFALWAANVKAVPKSSGAAADSTKGGSKSGGKNSKPGGKKGSKTSSSSSSTLAATAATAASLDPEAGLVDWLPDHTVDLVNPLMVYERGSLFKTAQQELAKMFLLSYWLQYYVIDLMRKVEKGLVINRGVMQGVNERINAPDGVLLETLKTGLIDFEACFTMLEKGVVEGRLLKGILYNCPDPHNRKQIDDYMDGYIAGNSPIADLHEAFAQSSKTAAMLLEQYSTTPIGPRDAFMESLRPFYFEMYQCIKTMIDVLQGETILFEMYQSGMWLRTLKTVGIVRHWLCTVSPAESAIKLMVRHVLPWKWEASLAALNKEQEERAQREAEAAKKKAEEAVEALLAEELEQEAKKKKKDEAKRKAEEERKQKQRAEEEKRRQERLKAEKAALEAEKAAQAEREAKAKAEEDAKRAAEEAELAIRKKEMFGLSGIDDSLEDIDWDPDELVDISKKKGGSSSTSTELSSAKQQQVKGSSSSTTTTTSGKAPRVARIVNWNGEWRCGPCNKLHRSRESCNVCDQVPPCRNWLRDACFFRKCKFPHWEIDFEELANNPPVDRNRCIVSVSHLKKHEQQQQKKKLQASSEGEENVSGVQKGMPAAGGRTIAVAVGGRAAAAPPPPPPRGQQPQPQQSQRTPLVGGGGWASQLFPSEGGALSQQHQHDESAESSSAVAAGGGGWSPFTGTSTGVGGSGLDPWQQQQQQHRYAGDTTTDSDLYTITTTASGPVVIEDEMDDMLSELGIVQPESAWRAAVLTSVNAELGGLAPGLANDSGEYNCFLNVVVQCLWHCDAFRKELMSWQPDVCLFEPVIAALRNLFASFAEREAARNGSTGRTAVSSGQPQTAVNPSELREALADLSDAQFKMGEMNDAGELLLTLYEHARQLSPQTAAAIDNIFGLMVRELVRCPACDLETHQNDYIQFMFNSQATAMRMAREFGTTRSMGQLLRLIEAQTQKSCDTDKGGCNVRYGVHHILENLPGVFTMQMTWESNREDPQDILATMETVDEMVSLADIYTEVEQHEASCLYRLRSMVCYYGAHYSAMVRSDEVGGDWVMFDDTSVSKVGPWKKVLEKCKAGRIQPSVLFYEAVA